MAMEYGLGWHQTNPLGTNPPKELLYKSMTHHPPDQAALLLPTAFCPAILQPAVSESPPLWPLAGNAVQDSAVGCQLPAPWGGGDCRPIAWRMEGRAESGAGLWWSVLQSLGGAVPIAGRMEVWSGNRAHALWGGAFPGGALSSPDLAPEPTGEGCGQVPLGGWRSRVGGGKCSQALWVAVVSQRGSFQLAPLGRNEIYQEQVPFVVLAGSS